MIVVVLLWLSSFLTFVCVFDKMFLANNKLNVVTTHSPEVITIEYLLPDVIMPGLVLVS